MKRNFNTYKGYFAQRGIKFTEQEVTHHKNFLFGQLKIIQKTTPINVGDMILDVGCGMGALISLLREIGIRNIEAIELDPDAADFVGQSQGVKVSTCEVEKYPGKCQFDKIFALEVLEHIHNPISALSKIHNLLRGGGGGYLIATSPFPFKKNIVSDETHLFVLHPHLWRRLLKEAGFSEVEFRPLTSLPFLYRFSRFFSFHFPIYIPGLWCVSTTLIIAKK